MGRLVSLAVLLGLTLFSGVVFTARAQSIDREIAGLTLSSDSPGELLISWDEPSPAPYDYRVNWAKSSEDFPSWQNNDGNAYPTTNSLTVTGLEEGETYKVRVRGRYRDSQDRIVNQSPWSDTVTGTVASTPTQNTPATGAPTISGTAEVGQTLTAGTSGISDTDGLTNVSYSYQWLADDSPVEGATGGTYTLVDTDAGKTIKVRVSFTDDGDNQESLTSAGTSEVKRPLTATIESAPDSHDGSSSFEVRIRFSERLKNGTLGGKVVRVTNGDNTASSRVDGDDEVWKITIEPDGDDDVIIKLAAGDDTGCVSGLACTSDSRPLSHDLTHTVEGPDGTGTDSEEDSDSSPVAPPEVPVSLEEARLPGDEGYVWLGVINGFERGKSRSDELDGSADDRNWYQFVVSGSNGKPSVKADLGLRQLDADADLFLRDRDGNVVEASRSEGTDDERIHMNLSGGVYYLEVRAREAGANAYTLHYGVSALDPEVVLDQSPQDTLTFVPNSFLYSHSGDQNSPPNSKSLLSSLHIPNWVTENEPDDKHLITLAPGESVTQPFYFAGPIEVDGFTLSFASLPTAVQPDHLDLRIVSCEPEVIRTYFDGLDKPDDQGLSDFNAWWDKIIDCTISLDSSGNVDSEDVLVEFHAPTSLDSRRVLFRNDRGRTRISATLLSIRRPYASILFTNRSSTDVTLDVVTTGYGIGSARYSCGIECDSGDYAMFKYAGSFNIRKGQARLPGIDRYSDDGTKMARRAQHGPDHRWGEMKFTLWGDN